MFLTRLIYFSSPNFEILRGRPDPVLMSILKAGLKNNPPKMLTGCLVIDSGFFIQLIEGPRDEVSHTFRKIMRDTRHRDIHLLNMEEISDRTYESFMIALNDNETLPACEPKTVMMDHMTADSIAERIRRISKIGMLAERKAHMMDISSNA